MKFRVTWWIHGAGRITRGTDIVEVQIDDLGKDEAEEMIQNDLDNARKEIYLGTIHFPNFMEKQDELMCEARHTEISNWKVLRVVREKKQ